jgi:uncharacterized protein (DUF4213/DUF364 family)
MNEEHDRPRRSTMKSTSIIQAWISDLQEVLENEPLTVDDIRIGVFYTAARLSDGHVGVAFTPRGLTDSVCCPQSAAEAPLAGSLGGRSAWSLAEYALSRAALRRAVGVATLNALSALALTRREIAEARILPGMDALDAAKVRPEDRVALIGAFVPFIKKLRHHVAALWVIDKHPEALRPDEKYLWCPPEKSSEALKKASLVIMTGSTLVEGGTDELLQSVRTPCRVVMAGPTASPWPPTFFARHVDVLAGIRVTDGPRLLEIVSQGGSGYFFGHCAEKISIVRVGCGAGCKDG